MRVPSVVIPSCLVLISIYGCSGGPKLPIVVPVKGTVTLDGNPLENASLTFISNDPKVKSGVATTDDKGNFEVLTYFDATHILKGIPAGEYKVTVTKMADSGEAPQPVMAVPKKEDRNRMQEQMMAKMMATNDKKAKKALPDKYSKPDSSGLKAIATAGMDPLKFELKND
jgi:hypothetical protein